MRGALRTLSTVGLMERSERLSAPSGVESDTEAEPLGTWKERVHGAQTCSLCGNALSKTCFFSTERPP